jgi:hypothetical protein
MKKGREINTIICLCVCWALNCFKPQYTAAGNCGVGGATPEGHLGKGISALGNGRMCNSLEYSDYILFLYICIYI